MMGRLILASGSESRRRILEEAGIAFEAISPRIDEEAAKKKLASRHATPSEIAVELAKLKAMQVSQEHAGAVVLGADQVLACEGTIYAKAKDLNEAKQILRDLRGRKHELLTAVVLARDGAVLWQYMEPASLWMDELSEAFLDDYVASEGKALLACVGCYRIEGRGRDLFTRVEGNNATIRGLPLAALCEALRTNGVSAR
jgi:septum formation protein